MNSLLDRGIWVRKYVVENCFFHKHSCVYKMEFFIMWLFDRDLLPQYKEFKIFSFESCDSIRINDRKYEKRHKRIFK